MVLTILSLVIGYFTLSMSTALLYATWLSGAGSEITPQFLAIASIGGLGFATLGGWLTALVAQRAPIAHAVALALIMVIICGLYACISEPKEPLPLSLLTVGVGTAGVMAGGWLRLSQMKASDFTKKAR